MNSAVPPVASLNLIVPVTIALSTVVQVELRIHLIVVPSKHSESKSSAAAGWADTQMWNLCQFVWVMQAL